MSTKPTYIELETRVKKLEQEIHKFKQAKNFFDELKLPVDEKQLYSVLVEQATDGIWCLDKDFQTVYVNPALEELLGFKQKEMIGRSWYDFGDPDWVLRAKELEKRRRSGVKEPHDFVFIHKNGSKVLTRISTTPIYDNGGNFTGAIGVLSDVSRQKEAEKAIETKNMLNSIAESTGISLTIINPDFTIEWQNQPLKKLSGGLAETKGRNCFEVFEKRNNICPDCPTRLTFKTGHSAVTSRTGISTKFGEDRIISIITSPILDDNGKVVQVIEIIQDITEQQRTEKDLKRVFDLSIDMICVANINGNFRKVNPAFTKTLGYEEYELLEKPYMDFVHPDDQLMTQQIGEEKLAKGITACLFENRYKCKDGSYKWLEWISKPIAEEGLTFAIARDVTERKLAEEKMRVNERLLNKSQEIAHLGSWHLDIKKNILTWSDEMYRIFGQAPQGFKATYEAFLDKIHPDDRDKVDKIYTNAIKNNLPYECTHRIIRNDGELRFVLEKSEDIVDENGEAIHSFGFTQDITERKSLEDAFLESEFLFRGVFNNMSSGVAIYEAKDNGSDFVFKDINRSGAKSGDVKRDDIIGKSVSKIFPGVVKLGLLDVFQRVWQTNIPEVHPVSLYKDEKIQFWTENFVFKLPSGEIVAVYDDVTKRKQAEEKLLTAKTEWEKTFDAMADLVTIQDKDMHIVRANKAVYKFFKIPLGELNGKYCYELFRGIMKPCPECPVIKVHKDDKHHSETIRHDGLNKIFSVSSSPILDENNELKYLVHIAKDVTEQKKMEEDLFQAHKMEAIGALAAGIAHDFNNILTAIIGFADMARVDSSDSSRSKLYLDQVMKAGDRAKDLVSQILSFSRKNHLQVGPLRPSLIIKEVSKLMRATLPSTIRLDIDIDSESGTILADPTQLHQILVNLCTNAFHAIENEKGTLKIKLSRKSLTTNELTDIHLKPGPFIILSVIDTGVGMDKETQKRIFEPYFTTKGAGKGTGVGLAVVYSIVNQYGGKIKVDSEVGRGSAFHVYLPAIELEIKDSNNDQAPIPTGKERILFVDDEEMVADLGLAMLESLGYYVTAKTNSAEALNLYLNDPSKFDLLITDQTMPNLSGSELAERFLQIRPDIPIILCTGYSNIINELKAKKIGISEYVTKPFDKDLIATMIRKVLDEV